MGFDIPVPGGAADVARIGERSVVHPGCWSALSLRQAPFPVLAARLVTTPMFAHPFERHFADQLDAYGIRWRYEPTTFLLASHPDGRPAECFTPDFYLPELRTYVELTSMRQRLVTRKHGKLRRFRLACPGTRVVLLYRRDYERMLSRWAGLLAAGVSSTGADPATFAIGRVAFDPETIRTRVDALADELAGRFAIAQPMPLLMAIGGGGTRFATDVAARLAANGTPTDVEELTVGLESGRLRLVRGSLSTLAGRPVIVVTGMVSTGLTVDFVGRWLRRRRADLVDVCTLFERRSARVSSRRIGYVGFDAPADLLVGYGLDLHREFRDLPFVATAAERPEPLALAGIHAPAIAQ